MLLIPQEIVSSHILVNPKAILHLSKLLADRARSQAVDVASHQMHARAVAQSGRSVCAQPEDGSAWKDSGHHAGLSQVRFGIYDTLTRVSMCMASSTARIASRCISP